MGQQCETSSVLDIVLNDPGNCLALLDKRVLIQFRQSLLSHAALDAAAKHIIPVLCAQTTTIGAIAIINGDAGVMPPDIQKRQQELIGGLLERPNMVMSTVTTGASIQATAARAVGRVLLMGRGSGKLRHTTDLHEATAWLSEKLDFDVVTLRDVITTVKKQGKPP